MNPWLKIVTLGLMLGALTTISMHEPDYRVKNLIAAGAVISTAMIVTRNL